MSRGRAVLGWLLVGAAGLVIAVEYWELPSAQACASVHAIDPSAVCRSSPSQGVFITAAVLGAAGLAFLAPWIIRFLSGRGPDR